MSGFEIAYLALGIVSAIIVLGGAAWLAIRESRLRLLRPPRNPGIYRPGERHGS